MSNVSKSLEVTKSAGHLDHQEEKLKEISELAKTPGRVREHADKWNRMTSAEKTMAFSSGHSAIISGQVVNAAQEVASSGSSGNSRPVSRKDDPDTDSGSVQPLDPIRKKWILAAALCEIEDMTDMLKEDPKLANFKDTTSGYTALHWAAKFARLDLIELLAGQYFVNTSVRSVCGRDFNTFRIFFYTFRIFFILLGYFLILSIFLIHFRIFFDTILDA